MTLDLLGPAAVSTEPVVLEGVGFWRRALARAIDLFVHMLIGSLTGMVAALLLLIGAALRGASPDAALAKLSADTLPGFAAALVGGIAMHVLCEGLHGSTLGKRLCGIIVINENGGPSNLAGALKRTLAYFVDALFFGLVAFQKMAASPKRQRVGDIWGRTMVVRIATLDPSTRPSRLRFAGAALAGLTADGLVIFLELAYSLVE
jgi:uncharacterized RDD family membrane protein YckC